MSRRACDPWGIPDYCPEVYGGAYAESLAGPPEREPERPPWRRPAGFAPPAIVRPPAGYRPRARRTRMGPR